MEVIETTISEHIFNQGALEGKVEGKAEGEIIGQIKSLEILYQEGVLTEEQLKKRVTPLRQELEELIKQAS